MSFQFQFHQCHTRFCGICPLLQSLIPIILSYLFDQRPCPLVCPLIHSSSLCALKVYTVVDEMFLAGEIRETSQTKVLKQLLMLQSLEQTPFSHPVLPAPQSEAPGTYTTLLLHPVILEKDPPLLHFPCLYRANTYRTSGRGEGHLEIEYCLHMDMKYRGSVHLFVIAVWMLQYSVPVLLMKSPRVEAVHFNMLTFHLSPQLQSVLYSVSFSPKARGCRGVFSCSSSLHLSLWSMKTLMRTTGVSTALPCPPTLLFIKPQHSFNGTTVTNKHHI